ncbi:hypothetical protein [Aliikangiella maris]|uniref:Uncharacterized protein n=2 Tax=Aliikangiella maris TaxID=3162458 RepID=A0ABV3MNJ0_9GAMM
MIKKIFFTTTLLAMSNLALAERPSFSYFEAGATELEHDLVVGDFTGFELTGSYELPDNFYIVGKAVITSDKDLDLDMETKTIGIGYHEKIFSNTVLFAQADAVAVVFSRPESGQFDEQGYQFSVGIKSQIIDNLEVELTYKRLSTGEVDEDFGDYRVDYALLGLHYIVASGVGIYADYEKEDDSERTVVGIRYEF